MFAIPHVNSVCNISWLCEAKTGFQKTRCQWNNYLLSEHNLSEYTPVPRRPCFNERSVYAISHVNSVFNVRWLREAKTGFKITTGQRQAWYDWLLWPTIIFTQLCLIMIWIKAKFHSVLSDGDLSKTGFQEPRLVCSPSCDSQWVSALTSGTTFLHVRFLFGRRSLKTAGQRCFSVDSKKGFRHWFLLGKRSFVEGKRCFSVDGKKGLSGFCWRTKHIERCFLKRQQTWEMVTMGRSQLFSLLLLIIGKESRGMPQREARVQTSTSCLDFDFAGFHCVPIFQCSNEGVIKTDAGGLFDPRYL